jgi:hypothetical protein
MTARGLSVIALIRKEEHGSTSAGASMEIDGAIGSAHALTIVTAVEGLDTPLCDLRFCTPISKPGTIVAPLPSMMLMEEPDFHTHSKPSPNTASDACVRIFTQSVSPITISAESVGWSKCMTIDVPLPSNSADIIAGGAQKNICI